MSTATANGEIVIIMATRGRPEMLAEVFASLKQNTAQTGKGQALALRGRGRHRHAAGD